MQLHLPFPEILLPHQELWALLDDPQRQAVIELLARLIAQSTSPSHRAEENNDE